ncbi:MAG: hypothetical protein ACTSYL_07595 [Candidatus Thorarchaeota archaeon]
MIELLHFVMSMISATVSIIVGLIFTMAYLKTRRRARLLWGVAFLFYAIGHLINSWIVFWEISIESGVGLFAMWLYVNFGGTGTIGLILFATLSLLTQKRHLRWIITFLFMIIYSGGTTLFAFVLPADTLYAFFNPIQHTPVTNMSWWVVVTLVPIVLVIGSIFVNHYRVTGLSWALWIGFSFLIYAGLLFIWPVVELKPLFYILRTGSVLLLGIGGIKLSRQ